MSIFHCRYSKLSKKKLKYLPSRFVITLCITCGVFYEAKNEGNKNQEKLALNNFCASTTSLRTLLLEISKVLQKNFKETSYIVDVVQNRMWVK